MNRSHVNIRKADIYLWGLLLCGGLLVFLLFVHPWVRTARHAGATALKIQIVQTLGLTDLCLFTEARYTRHLSQSDLYSAFQDHPMSFEHFPSGSLTRPPVLHSSGIRRPKD
jgi:hypothetical protein